MAQRSESVAQTFLFADLSGFTALTEAHGDEQAADLVGGFCGAVRRLLAAHQAEIRLGLCIVHDVGAQHGFPLVRVGMHTGPAVEREGDWFGATVNLAARVSAAAAGGDALLTAATRTAAGDLDGVELRERGRWTFRNVTEPVPVYAAGPGRGAELGWAADRPGVPDGGRSLAQRRPAHPRGRGVLLLLAGVCRPLRPAPSQIRRR